MTTTWTFCFYFNLIICFDEILNLAESSKVVGTVFFLLPNYDIKINK